MIISHKYRYLFIELPRTGTMSIAKELIAKYDGKEIIGKHAKYSDFLKFANDNEKTYFVFSCIRNPIWRTISEYEKFYNDRMNYNLSYSEWLPKLKSKNIFKYLYLKERLKFTKDKATFEQFIRRYYRIPYDDWSSLNHKTFDYIIKFENIDKDFETALSKIGITMDSSLPKINATIKKKKDLSDYVDRDNAKLFIIKKFGPFMEKWGYELPDEWQHLGSYYKIDLANYVFWSFIKKFLWKYISFRNFKKSKSYY